MKKTYYAITKESMTGFDLYLTVKLIRNIPYPMFTGTKDLAYTFESEKEANDFYENYPWSEVPQITIKSL